MANPATPDLLEEVRERLEVFLAEGGHRKTPERFAVLEEIYTAGGHFDVDTLLDRMKQRGTKVSRATLYNTIELFLEAGLQEQLDRVVQGRPAHLGAALLHPVQQGVDIEVSPGCVNLLQHGEALRRLPMPALREEDFEALPHLFQQIRGGWVSHVEPCTKPRNPARNR